jgi:SM-20-related protein
VFELNPALDVAALAQRFASHGRVHVPDLLSPPSAQALAQHLEASPPWVLVFNHGDKLYELDAAMQRSLGEQRLATLVLAAQNSGRDAFQYLYETVRVPDAASERDAQAAAGNVLARFAAFLNGTAFLTFARAVTAGAGITWADSQATCYRRGHFLTTHDDAVDGKQRVAAYVVNLTRHWRAEWGGQLQFLGPDGHVAEAFVPRFNSLNLLRVPQPHLVSAVAPLAGSQAQRLSVTGWLRGGTPP